jgi:hypothetical protein
MESAVVARGRHAGDVVGVLPGLRPVVTVALLLPVTYGLDPTAALIMFAGIYSGAMYGGSTTSILLNTPGEGATIVTALDGYQMARAGRGGDRLLRRRHARHSTRSVVDPKGSFRGPVRPWEVTGSGWAQNRHSGDGRGFGKECGTRSGPSPKIKSLGGEDCCAERLFRRHPREVRAWPTANPP